jgi:hypothetical protein
MLGFVIALKGKAKSKNWSIDSQLVKRTIFSLLNQEDKNLRIYIAYTDLPENPVENERVVWIKFPYPFAEMDDIQDREVFLTRYTLGSYLPGFYDQGKKSLFAASYARKEGCRYVMSVDYDDLLSCKLSGFVNSADPETNYGWYMNKGFIYKEGSKYLLKVPERINDRCGSANIIRIDYVPNPDFSSMKYQDFKFFPTHNFIPEWLKIDHNIDILPLPFYGLIYLVHNTNFYNSKTRLQGNKLKSLLKSVIRGKLVTSGIRKEFGLYKLPK